MSCDQSRGLRSQGFAGGPNPKRRSATLGVARWANTHDFPPLQVEFVLGYYSHKQGLHSTQGRKGRKSHVFRDSPGRPPPPLPPPIRPLSPHPAIKAKTSITSVPATATKKKVHQRVNDYGGLCTGNAPRGWLRVCLCFVHTLYLCSNQQTRARLRRQDERRRGSLAPSSSAAIQALTAPAGYGGSEGGGGGGGDGDGALILKGVGAEIRSDQARLNEGGWLLQTDMFIPTSSTAVLLLCLSEKPTSVTRRDLFLLLDEFDRRTRHPLLWQKGWRWSQGLQP